MRKPIRALIQQDFPEFEGAASLTALELNEYRHRYLENFFVREVGELTELEETVLGNVHGHRTLTDKAEEPEQPLTQVQRCAKTAVAARIPVPAPRNGRRAGAAHPPRSLPRPRWE